MLHSHLKSGTEWNRSVDLTMVAAHQNLGISEHDAVTMLQTLPLEESTKGVSESAEHSRSCYAFDFLSCSQSCYLACAQSPCGLLAGQTVGIFCMLKRVYS